VERLDVSWAGGGEGVHKGKAGSSKKKRRKEKKGGILKAGVNAKHRRWEARYGGCR